MNIKIILITGMIFLFAISFVNAEENYACCEKTTNGAWCQYDLEENCDSDFNAVPTECEYVDYCKLGCCYSEETGLCDVRTNEQSCEGKWEEDAYCNIPECQKGCCVIGRQTIFTTEKNCLVNSRFAGFEKDFRPEINTELECIFFAEREDEGACVKNYDCEIKTRDSCRNSGGEFNKGKYCSDPSLDTECIAHDHIECFEQSVYWFDSCGNREEIKEECSIFSGTICSLVGTNYRCKSINCEVEIDGERVTKKNGESWCEYEGTIGQGRDPVGSTHIRHMCSMGEEIIEECAEYRNEICANTEIEINGTAFDEAICTTNTWLQCLDYNKETSIVDLREKCSGDPLCFMQSVYVDKYFQFDYCVSQSPPGFDIKSEDPNRNGEDICGMATQSCIVIFVKNWRGKWECEENCDCLPEEGGSLFTEEMNDFCTSLGDCGAYVNVAGEITDDGYSGSRLSALPDSYLNSKKNYANTPEGSLEVNRSSEFLESYDGYRMTIENLGYLAGEAEDHAESEYKQSFEYWFTWGPIGDWFGVGDTEAKYVIFNCLPWQPPIGGSNCDKCDDNGLCSEYECRSLGQTCEIVNKGTEFQACTDGSSTDVSSPKISPLEGFITEGYSYDNINENGFEINELGSQCIPEFTTVEFGIETNKLAQCKVSTDPTERYEDMENNYFGGSNFYLTNHTTAIVMPSVEALENEFEGIEVEGLGNFTFYVKCQTPNGAATESAYGIRVCVKEGPDIAYPAIRKVEPEALFIKYNATTKFATFWVNEPSECKWSKEDKRYDEMENQMECDNGLGFYNLEGFPCNATLDVSDATKFYIRCRDKSENNNTMTESYIYELQRTTEELRIASTTPQNGQIIRAGSSPVTLDLEVLTSGGAEDGKAICSFKFKEESQYINFFETESNTHKQSNLRFVSGEHNITIKCEDAAGNILENSIQFNIYVDTDSPTISRVYYDSGLKIMTDEDSVCGYSTTDYRCGFDIENITENAHLMTGERTEHTADWQTEQNYYIKCMDDYGNQPGRCSLVVRPYDVI